MIERISEETLTFNIIETAIDYEGYGNWVKCIFIVVCLGMAPIDSNV